MIGLAVRSDFAVFHFDEITDVDVFGQYRTWTQARVRADDAGVADDGIFKMAWRIRYGRHA